MTAVTKERQETMEAIQEHRKAHEMVNVRRGTSGDLTDPWLTEKALQMQLERMVQQENYYQMRMLAIQNDIKECEKVLVVTLKAIADDFVFGKETSFTHLRVSNFIGSQRFGELLFNRFVVGTYGHYKSRNR